MKQVGQTLIIVAIIAITIGLAMVCTSQATTSNNTIQFPPNEPPHINRTGGPDGYGYTYVDSASGAPAFAWDTLPAAISLTMDAASWNNSVDNGYYTAAPCSLGFAFPFYGNNYTRIYPGINGYLTFGAGSSVIPALNVWPTAVGSDAILFWGRDFQFNATVRVKYQSFVGNPSKFVIEYDSLPRGSTGGFGALYRISSQITLYSTGDIKIQYRYIGSQLRLFDSAFVGIQTAATTGNMNLAYTTNTATQPDKRVLYFANNCNFATLSSPANNSNGLPAGTTTLSWSGGSCSNNYDVYIDTVQSNVTNSVASACVASALSATSFQITILSNHLYYWKVVAHGIQPATANSAVWSLSTWQPLSGIYTIGATGSNFTTFGNAIAALNIAGVGTGGATFNVASGVYNEYVVVNAITNASATNPVTFRGVDNNVFVNPTATASTEGAIKLYGCQWVTFDRINVSDVSAGTSFLEYGYWIANANGTQGAQNNTIKNASITMRTQYISFGIYQYGTSPTSAAGAQSNNHYLNLRVSKARYGIYLNSPTSFPDVNNEVGSDIAGTGYVSRSIVGALEADTIGGPGAGYGIAASNQNNLRIHDLDVRNVITTTGAANGISISTPTGPITIYNCRVYNIIANGSSTYPTVYGIYVTNTGNYTNRIYNNMVWGQYSVAPTASATAAYYVYGIYTSASACLFNNTVVVDTLGTQISTINCSSAAIYCTAGNDSVWNNIIANLVPDQTTPYHTGLYINNPTALSSNNNCFYIPNPNQGKVGCYSGTYYAVLNTWITAPTNPDFNSASGDPLFLCTDCPMDLHIQLQQPSSLVDGTARSFPLITTDIDNDTRSASTPDIGADEGQFLSSEGLQPAVLVSPANWATGVTNPVTFRWIKRGTTGNMDVYLSTLQSDVDSLVAGARICSAITDTFTVVDNLPAGQIYYWCVVARDTTTGQTIASGTWNFITYVPPLTGTKTIGGESGTYANFSTALTVLSQYGVGTGGVIFNVAPGTYNEHVVVGPIPNASAANPIIFRKGSGTVTISPAATSQVEAAVKFYGCQWVTFDGIGVVDTSIGVDFLDYGYWLTNVSSTQGAQHNKIINASIKLRNDFVTYAVYQKYSFNPTSAAGTQSNNTFLNLKISNTRCGLYVNGYNTTYPDQNIEIGSDTSGINYPNRFIVGSMPGDTIGGSGTAYGIQVLYAGNLHIHDLDVTNIITYTQLTLFDAYGIYVTNLAGANTINGCRVYNLKGVGNSGHPAVYGITVLNNGTNPNHLYNNMVYGLTTGGGLTGWSFLVRGIYSTGTTVADNNSILIDQIDDVGYLSCAMYLGGGFDTLRNNILANLTMNQSATSFHSALFSTSMNFPDSLTSDYNDFYIPNTGNGVVGYFGNPLSYVTYADLNAWHARAARLDPNSVSGNPDFVSTIPPYDAHLQVGFPSIVENRGLPLSYITTDIDNEPRSPSQPDMGADEGAFNSPTAPSRPQLISPLNGTQVLQLPVTFTWNHCTQADSYDVYLSTSLTSVTLFDEGALAGTVSDTTFTTSTLTQGQLYYWRTVAKNSNTLETTAGDIWNIKIAVTGTKTIGATGCDFTDIQSAATALSTGGVGNGGAIFQIRPGPYSGPITINPVLNASASNTIVFANDQTGTCSIFTPGTSASNDYFIKLNGASWVTLDGLTIADTGTSSSNYVEYGVWVTSASDTMGAQNNTIKNCTISLRSTNNSSAGIYQHNTVNATTRNGALLNNHYLNLKISKARIGVSLVGSNIASGLRDGNNEVGSLITDLNNPNRFAIGGAVNDTISLQGINVSYQDSLTLHDFDISNVTTVNTSNGSGINIGTMYGKLVISGSRLYNCRAVGTSATAYSMYGINLNPTTTIGSVYIYNNFIYGLSSSWAGSTPSATLYVAGIWVVTVNAAGSTFIDHNSILLEPALINPANDLLLSSSCISLQNQNSYVTMRNNILYNKTAAQSGVARHFAIYKAVTATITPVSDFNVLYTPNTNGFVGYWNNTASYDTTLAQWVASTGYDLRSYSGDPLFVSGVSPYDLHVMLSQPASVVENHGTPIPWVGWDIDHEARSVTVPDIGADEGLFVTQQQIAMTPSDSVRFGTVIVGTTDSVAIWVKNSGGGVLNVLNITTPTGVTASWTSHSFNFGDSLQLWLYWTVASGPLTGNVTVTSNSSTLSTYILPVTGYGVMAPSIPVLTVTYNGTDAILNWTASTGDITEYRVYRFSTGYFTPPSSGTLIATVPGGITNYQDAGIGGHYYYRVTAFTNLMSSTDSR